MPPVINFTLSFVGWGVCPPHAVLESVSSFWSVGSFSFTPRAGIYLIVPRVGNLSYTHPVLESFSSFRWVGSFSYTPRAEFCLVVYQVESVYYTPPAGIRLVVSVGVEFFLHAPC